MLFTEGLTKWCRLIGPSSRPVLLLAWQRPLPVSGSNKWHWCTANETELQTINNVLKCLKIHLPPLESQTRMLNPSDHASGRRTFYHFAAKIVRQIPFTLLWECLCPCLCLSVCIVWTSSRNGLTIVPPHPHIKACSVPKRWSADSFVLSLGYDVGYIVSEQWGPVALLWQQLTLSHQ